MESKVTNVANICINKRVYMRSKKYLVGIPVLSNDPITDEFMLIQESTLCTERKGNN